MRKAGFALVALLVGVLGSALSTTPAQAEPIPRDRFALTSMCKPDPAHGELRITNDTPGVHEYTLRKVDGDVVLTGTTNVGYTYVTVDWTSPSDTWQLTIEGHTYTEVIGDNPTCPPAPGRDRFDLTVAECRPDATHVTLRIRNSSDQVQPYRLFKSGAGIEDFRGEAGIGDTLVTVPWAADHDTWNLEIARYTYTRGTGDRPICATASPQPTGTASPQPTGTASPTPTGTAAPATPGATGSPASGGGLPVTGDKTSVIALVAVGLLAAGGAAFLLARRRRVTFTS